MHDLRGQVIIVTGANRGQGRAIAEYLSIKGATVGICARKFEEAEKVVKDIGSVHSFPLKLDVTKQDEWQEAIDKTINQFNRIDTLVNNAGAFSRNSFSETTLKDYYDLINVNQLGIFMGMQAVMPQMEKQSKGSIINNLSISAFSPISKVSAYASTKAAVVAMSKAVAIEYGPKGIRVNMIHPGGVNTDMMTSDNNNSPENYDSIPLGRVGKPIDIAKAAAFLASDESAYCTGLELVVDGGLTLGTSD